MHLIRNSTPLKGIESRLKVLAAVGYNMDRNGAPRPLPCRVCEYPSRLLATLPPGWLRKAA